MTTSNEGVVTIYFSESLIIPSNFTSINGSALNVKILPFNKDNIKFLNFTWNVT